MKKAFITPEARFSIIKKTLKLLIQNTLLRPTVCNTMLARKWRFFKAPTLIKSKDGDIVANAGSTYNTETQQSNFKGRSKIVNEEYTLIGDTLNFDQKN